MSATMNTTGTVIRVREVWQTDQDRTPAGQGDCLRGLIVRRDPRTNALIRPVCNGRNCSHS